MLSELQSHVYATWLAVLGGLTPWWPVLAAAILIEAFRPGERTKALPILFNLVYLPVGLTLGAVIVSPPVNWVQQWIPSDVLGIGKLKSDPIMASAVWLGYLLAFDFFYYWFHRAQHRIPFLWRYHMVHHSDSNVSASTVGRHHWMEDAFRLFLLTGPLIVLLGGGIGVPLWATAFIVFNGILMHWNVPFRFGPLEKVFITPAYHRIHHSVEPAHWDKNFGVFTQTWDKLFGTRHVPAKGEFPQTGVVGLPQRHTIALLSPWPIRLMPRMPDPGPVRTP
jgi:sterol desaturase/sphingolipid hydroxylase (fatty acid hydroxylase superfamily)